MDKTLEQQRKLAAWADRMEAGDLGPMTSLYWRLLPQIIDARAALKNAKKP